MGPTAEVFIMDNNATIEKLTKSETFQVWKLHILIAYMYMINSIVGN